MHVTINGVTQDTTVDSAGFFTINYTTIPGAGIYPITYTYDGNATLWTVTDSSTLLTVSNQTVPTITSWPTPTSGITYGDALSAALPLIGGSASVPGTFTFTAEGTIPPVGTGTYAASGTFTPVDTGNYATVVTPAAISVEVAQKTLTLDTPAVTSRPYNGTNAATITGTLNGVVAGDETLVSLVGTGTFADTIPGTHAVTASCTLSGSAASNYTLTQPTGLSGDITSATLTVTPNHVSRAVGAANPSPFPYTITGYQNGENAETANVDG